MKSKFSRFTPYVIGTLAVTTGVIFGNLSLAEPSPRDLLNPYVPDPILTTEEMAANQQIEFRTLVPEQSLVMPQEGKKLIIKFGLRITNNSSLERQFVLLPGRLRNFSIDRPQHHIAMECAYGGAPDLSNPLDFLKSLRPGESVETFDTATLYRENGEVMIRHVASDKYCRFTGFKAGSHAIFINYQGSKRLWSVDRRDIWVGEVDTIPAKFDLLESP